MEILIKATIFIILTCLLGYTVYTMSLKLKRPKGIHYDFIDSYKKFIIYPNILGIAFGFLIGVLTLFLKAHSEIFSWINALYSLGKGNTDNAFFFGLGFTGLLVATDFCYRPLLQSLFLFLLTILIFPCFFISFFEPVAVSGAAGKLCGMMVSMPIIEYRKLKKERGASLNAVLKYLKHLNESNRSPKNYQIITEEKKPLMNIEKHNQPKLLPYTKTINYKRSKPIKIIKQKKKSR